MKVKPNTYYQRTITDSDSLLYYTTDSSLFYLDSIFGWTLSYYDLSELQDGLNCGHFVEIPHMNTALYKILNNNFIPFDK